MVVCDQSIERISPSTSPRPAGKAGELGGNEVMNFESILHVL
jgi:hypothetical protein